MRLHLPRFDRTTVTVIVGALLFVAAYGWMASYIRDYYDRTSPSPSVFSESGRGLSVCFRYLDALGLSPQTLQSFDALPDRATIVVAGPLDLTPGPSDAVRLASWVRSGGRLVVLGNEASPLMDGLGAQATPTTGRPLGAVEPSLPGPYVRGIRAIAPGEGRLTPEDPAWVAIYRDSDGPVLLSRTLGAGEVVWLADTRPLTNDGIGERDDAALAVALASQGGRAIYFDEYHHGFVNETNVWGRLGDGGRAAVVLLGAALALFVGFRARRVAPALRPPEEPAARGGAYIAQLADLYRRAGARAEALESLEDGLARRLSRKYGTRAAGLARQAGAARALEESAALRAGGDIGRDEFLAAAKRLRLAITEVEGTHG